MQDECEHLVFFSFSKFLPPLLLVKLTSKLGESENSVVVNVGIVEAPRYIRTRYKFWIYSLVNKVCYCALLIALCRNAWLPFGRTSVRRRFSMRHRLGTVQFSRVGPVHRYSHLSVIRYCHKIIKAGTGEQTVQLIITCHAVRTVWSTVACMCVGLG